MPAVSAQRDYIEPEVGIQRGAVALSAGDDNVASPRPIPRARGERLGKRKLTPARAHTLPLHGHFLRLKSFGVKRRNSA